MTDPKEIFVIPDVTRLMQMFCPPGFRPQVEICNFDCPEMRDRLNTLVRLTDILMEVEKEAEHSIKCKSVKSWPFHGECNCFLGRVKKELNR